MGLVAVVARRIGWRPVDPGVEWTLTPSSPSTFVEVRFQQDPSLYCRVSVA
jgi:hypothetical protein